MTARICVFVLSLLVLASCANFTPDKSAANKSSATSTPGAAISPLKQVDAKSYCLAHCANMSDRDRIEYFAQFIWAPYVESFNRSVDLDARAQAVTLQLNGSGKHWEDAAREAALFTKVSPGKWNMKIVVTPRETVRQLAELASKSFESGTGPGEVIISGLLKAGETRIEITRLQ